MTRSGVRLTPTCSEVGECTSQEVQHDPEPKSNKSFQAPLESSTIFKMVAIGTLHLATPEPLSDSTSRCIYEQRA
jgi:hypothetical protein